MLKQAEKKMNNLLHDDSGIAIAWTILTFLCFFMICVSTYAMSENIRRKMVLQNSCDAAAYSGAVVQADTLSRIAVLNRALSWTYAQTNKRQMDETVYKWLNSTLNDPTEGYYSCENTTRIKGIAASSGCLCPAKTGIAINGQGCFDGGGTNDMHYWLVGVVNSSNLALANYYVGGDATPQHIRLNNSQNVSIYDIQYTLNGYVSQSEDIDNGINNIDILNREIAYLSENINTFITMAIKSTITNSGFSSDSDVKFTYSLEGNRYFEAETSEENLLNYSGKTSAGEFQGGCNTWWVLQNNLPDYGIGRNYEQSVNSLLAEFSWVVCTHADSPYNPCVHSYVTGDTVTFKGKTSTQIVAKPWKLTQGFFGRAGSIVIAAKQGTVNPFSVLLGPVSAGLYHAFSPQPMDMWAVSAARAGVRLNGDDVGYYRVQWPGNTVSDKGYTNSVWNLCEEDWDAVLLPVNRAWNETNGLSQWTGNPTTVELMKEVRNRLNPRSALTDAQIDSLNGHVRH